MFTKRMNTCPPPPIHRTRFSPTMALAGFVFLAALAQAVVHGLLPLPRCVLLQFTGVPCPTCGCTRSLAAWTQLNFADAFQFNPLFFLVCVSVVTWAFLQLTRTFAGNSQRHFPSLRLRSNAAWAIGAVAVLLNWVYLWLALPR